MKASISDMRRNPKRILDAIERNERVTLTNRGKAIAEIVPKTAERKSIADDQAVGMWADRTDLADPVAFVRDLRKGRFGVL